MSLQKRKSIERNIGLPGAVLTLVGCVIGASVFILPAELAAQAGPAVVISYGIASLMAVFSCLIGAQIGVIFPVSGASFVASARLISPFFGFLYVWMVLAGVVIIISVVALGFANYFNELFPGIDVQLVAVMAVIFFAGVNLLGARVSVFGQVLMVLGFMSVLVAFCWIGGSHIETTLMVPLFPNGFGSVMIAAVPAYFSYMGFQLIIEVGGEIKNPGKNIPLALLISFIIVWLTYSAVALVIVGVIPWQELGELSAPFTVIAEKTMPYGVSTVITLTVLIAAASSLNGLLFSFSREVLVLSKVRIFPRFLGTISQKNGEPINGVVSLAAAACIVLMIGGSIAEYATVCVLGLMFGQVLLALSAMRMPKLLPEAYNESRFQLGPVMLTFIAWGAVLFSTIFVAIGVVGSPQSLAVAVVIVGVGVLYYFLRGHYLNSLGVHLSQTITEIIVGMMSKSDVIQKPLSGEQSEFISDGMDTALPQSSSRCHD